MQGSSALAKTGRRARRALVGLALVALVAVSCAPLARAAGSGRGMAVRASEALGSPPALWGPGIGSLEQSAPGARALRKSAPGVSLTRSASTPYWACPQSACEAIVDPPAVPVRGRRLRDGALARFALPAGGPLLEGSGEEGGLDPQDLQSAYKIPTSGGSSQTVALVDAYSLPEAETELATYRARYGLPACTKADGCFRRVNQRGKESDYPAVNEGWDTESALDIEMVSAACPECHILLVEASSSEGPDLAEAVDTAARLGATEISNSWGSPEQVCGVSLCAEEAADFDHPGILITAAAGDDGYDNVGLGAHSPEYPASLPDVVAVGGTALHKAEDARGWSEEAWSEGGSGCSRFAKPEWQTDPACAGRMTADVAADAACETPVSIYNIHEWALVCGTSVSTPLVAGIEAHASEYARSLPGAEAFYEDPSALFDVTKGSNGKCTPPNTDAYYCRAGPGYDGPTGNGSPDGPLELAGQAPPVAASRPASAASESGATLNGVVDPDGLETTYHFEYGSTTSYGTSVPVPDASVGTSAQAVSQSITDLSPESVYHYRLVATSSAGTSYGEDVAFTTGAPTVSALAPDTGPDGGGTSVTITGTNFIGASAVKFGPSEAESFTVDSETTISAISPPGAGPADVTVTGPAGSGETSADDRFNYEKLGAVLAWGHRTLGDGTSENSSVPVEVSGLPEASALAVGGEQNLAVLKGDGRVVGWGENLFGTVGNGTYAEERLPVGVCAPGLSACPNGPYLEEATAVSGGVLHSLALLKNGTVMAWGENIVGELGSDSEGSRVPVPVCTTVEAPCKPENYLKEVKAIAAGAFFSLALLDNGTVVAWGENASGQLGDGSTSGPELCDEGSEACSQVPVPVPGLSHVKAIAAGYVDGFALLEDGRVMAWGKSEVGELGDDSTGLRDTPTAVCAVGETASPCKADLEEVTAIAGSVFNGYALLKNGTVAAWGVNAWGELGDDTPSGPKTCKLVIEKGYSEKLPCSPGPVKVKGLGEVSAIASGPESTGALAQLNSGQLLSWGYGRAGGLGDGTDTNSETPVAVCQAYASGPCPDGADLGGQLTAMAVGEDDIVGFPASPGPVVNGVQPDTGPDGGGTAATVIGADFNGVTAVDFGGRPASEFRVESPDELVAISPPGSGTVDVTVSTAEGVSPTNPADRFTYPGAPGVLTGVASQVGPGAAKLNATVNPNARALSDCHFEYGTTPAYGSSVPCSSLPGAGTSPVSVSAVPTSLHAGTSYYFRAAASNTEGTGYGAQQSFTTAALPQLGRCVKLAGRDGAYKNTGCTTASAGGDSGRYEWQAWPFADEHISGGGGGALFETVTYKTSKGRDVSTKVTCTGSTLSGEYTSAQSAEVLLTFTGCGVCRSPGAGSEEVKVGPLEAQLGIIATKPKPSVGWMLNAYSSTALMEPECLFPTPLPFVGSLVGAVTRLDKMSTGFTLKFEGHSGHQAPEGFEDGVEDTLSLNEHQAALTLEESYAGNEAVEVKALE